MDGNLAMNSHFENLSEEDTNKMTEYYESKKLLIEFYNYLQSEGKFPNSSGLGEFWAERFLNIDCRKT